jgi:hypothetical protein
LLPPLLRSQRRLRVPRLALSAHLLEQAIYHGKTISEIDFYDIVEAWFNGRI